MAQDKSIELEWWLRLGTHAEKDYAVKTRSVYDCLVINANLLIATPAASASLILAAQKPFVVDPMTYAFALSPGYLKTKSKAKSTRGKLLTKRTYANLASEYGEPVSGAVGKRAIGPGDFRDKLLGSFAAAVHEFQNTYVAKVWDSETEMRDIALLQDVDRHASIAPYFYIPFSHDAPDWITVNCDLARSFMENCSEEEAVYVPICMDEAFLDRPKQWAAVASAFSDLPCSGYMLWLSDLREERAPYFRLQALKDLVLHLSRGGTKRVVNGHGGFLSCTLCHFGLTGLSHGFGYGEHRDIRPVMGGGLPPARYYFRPLHRHLVPSEVEALLPGMDVTTPAEFHERVCNCSICRGTVCENIDDFEKFYEVQINEKGNEVTTPEAYRRSRFHFLLARRAEMDWVTVTSADSIAEELRKTYSNYSEEVGLPDAAHLDTWAEVLAPSDSGAELG